MAKRKMEVISSSDEDNAPTRVTASESPERPLQTARRTGKKLKKGDDEESAEETLKQAKPKGKSKSSKATATPVKKPTVPKSHSDVVTVEDIGDVKVGVNQDGERYVDLGKKRRATVNLFKGGMFLDIREHYGDESDLKPGKKGISLSQEQWKTLKNSSSVIDSFFAKLK